MHIRRTGYTRQHKTTIGPLEWSVVSMSQEWKLHTCCSIPHRHPEQPAGPHWPHKLIIIQYCIDFEHTHTQLQTACIDLWCWCVQKSGRCPMTWLWFFWPYALYQKERAGWASSSQGRPVLHAWIIHDQMIGLSLNTTWPLRAQSLFRQTLTVNPPSLPYRFRLGQNTKRSRAIRFRAWRLVNFWHEEKVTQNVVITCVHWASIGRIIPRGNAGAAAECRNHSIRPVCVVNRRRRQWIIGTNYIPFFVFLHASCTTAGGEIKVEAERL